MKYIALFVWFLFLALSASNAQTSEQDQEWCGSNYVKNEILKRYASNPSKLLEMESKKQELEDLTAKFGEQGSAKSGSDYIIPVVFHIIHDFGPENISDDQIYDAVRILNESFNKQNASWTSVNPAFTNIVADIGIEFRLAQKDPNGDCTNGITRTNDELTYSGDFDMMALIQWDRSEYLNIWVCAGIFGGGIAAYTQIPSWVDGNPGEDGIVSLHTYVGSIGTGAVQRSTALAHEVGHWLNLYHTWGEFDGPGLQSNCNDDDLVADTPNTIGWTSCNLNGTTCGSLDNVENFMSYSYCNKMFTEGQKTRMLAALNSSIAERDQLWKPSNLSQTGTDGPGVLCQVDFKANKTEVCAGDSIIFDNISFNGVVGQDWVFSGGNPGSSQDSDPVVFYYTPGTYDVSLTASDGNSNITNTKTQFITVLPSIGFDLPYEEGFENISSLPSNDWFIYDPQEDGGFGITANAAYSGSQSVKLSNSSNDAGNLDELSSNTINLKFLQDVTITFKYAYRRRNDDNDDRLRFYVSNDCGESWSLRKQFRGQTNLPTGNNVSGSWTPSSPADWNEAVIDNIQASYLEEGFRFKFWFESDGGNNLYIDDININSTSVGINELTAEDIGLSIFPNPITNVSTLIFELKERSEVQIDVLDVLGRTILALGNGSLSQGEHQYPISRTDLGNGMYFVRISVNDEKTMVRFIVN